MVTNELQTQAGSRIQEKVSKMYILSSLLIIVMFLGINFLGYFLGLMNDFVLIILFTMFFIVTSLNFLYSNRLETVSIEKWGKTFRKYSHLVGGLVMLLFAFLSVVQTSWICFSILMTFLLHEYFYVKKNIYSVFTRTLIFVGRLDRRVTQDSQTNRKPFYPTMWLLAAISAMGLFVYLGIIDQFIVIAAIIAFALGDSLSTIIGEGFGEHNLPYNKTKSIEGTLAFFGITFVSVFFVFLMSTQFFWVHALIAALVGCIFESFIPTNYWLDDNFVIPTSITVALFLTTLL